MERLWSSAVSYYGCGKNFQNVIRFSVFLTEKIDFALFQSAVQKASVRYPYLSVQRVKQHGKIILSENPAPWPVLCTNRPAVLGSKECNGHMLAFSVYEDSFFLDCFHGLMDARAAIRVIRTTLYLYLKERYNRDFSVPNLLVPGEPISGEEFSDPSVRTYPRMKPSTFFRLKRTAFSPKTMHLGKMRLIQKCHPQNFKFTIEQSSIMQYCSSYDASPATALFLMLARAIQSVHTKSKKQIRGGMIADLRPAFSARLSHHSNILTLCLPFDKRTQKLSFEKQGTVCRGRLILENDPERMLENAGGMNHVYRLLNGLPTLRAKQFTAGKMAHAVMSANTYLVSYAGYSSFGEMEPYIRGLYTDIDPWDSGIVLEINAIADTFYISFSQEWKETVYLDAFLKELSRHGIRCKRISDGSLPFATVQPV